MLTVQDLEIKACLQQFRGAYFNEALQAAHTLKPIQRLDGKIIVTIQLDYPLPETELTNLKFNLQDHLGSHFSGVTFEVNLNWRVARHQVQNDLKPKLGIKNLIAVGSGKGGVGKSTVSVNLALSLSRMGAKVGLLDADIYGPSQTMMLGINEKPDIQDKKIIPLSNYGITMMSMGCLVDADIPMIWRGPMVSGALLQLLNDTHWPELDYLIVDLPPGTGDIQLTMAQKLPISGAVVVTTPQDIALLDAKRAIGMFNKVSIPVLGIIENMSHHICNHCGHSEAIFGEGGGARMAEQFDLPLLGQIPLVSSIRQQVDNGKPTVVAEPDGIIAQNFNTIAQNIAVNLAKRPKDYTVAMPMKMVQTET